MFAQARRQAYTSTCLSNLRQIGNAFQMYLQDHDETFPVATFSPVYSPFTGRITDPGPGRITRCRFRSTTSIEQCLLPYTKTLQVFVCPASQFEPDVYQNYQCSYLYRCLGNHAWNDADICGYPLASLRTPAEKVIYFDNQSHRGVRLFSGPDSWSTGATHPRNYLYADGHAKLVMVSNRTERQLNFTPR